MFFVIGFFLTIASYQFFKILNIFPETISYDLRNFNHFQKIGNKR